MQEGTLSEKSIEMTFIIVGQKFKKKKDILQL